MALSFTALPGIPEVEVGADLAELIAKALDAADLSLQAHDVLVVAQKAVSKAEGRFVDLASVVPSARAKELAGITGKDARLVELILSESVDVLRAKPGVLIVRHRLGYVMANAGIDRSNVANAPGEERVLLLPVDANASAAAIRAALELRLGTAPAVIVSDSFGRPWREGVVNVAIGAAGLPSLVDRRGEKDRHGRALEITQVALADAIAAGAALVMGEGSEGNPVVHVRGLTWQAPPCDAGALIRPLDQDLFK